MASKPFPSALSFSVKDIGEPVTLFKPCAIVFGKGDRRLYTGFYIDKNYIYGQHADSGRFYIDGGYVYGPRNSGKYYLHNNYFYGPKDGGEFYLDKDHIYGPRTSLPWLE